MKWNWQTAIKAGLLILNSTPKWYLTIRIVALESSHKVTIERMTEARRPAMFTSSACHRAKRRPPVKE